MNNTESQLKIIIYIKFLILTSCTIGNKAFESKVGTALSSLNPNSAVTLAVPTLQL